MKTKVEPTVEKWGSEFRDEMCEKVGELYYWRNWFKGNPDLLPTPLEVIQKYIIPLALSVQEAKAEERERIEDKIKVETAKALADLNQEFPDKMTAGGGLVGRVVPERERYLKTKRAVLLDLLASLKQEEGKV